MIFFLYEYYLYLCLFFLTPYLCLYMVIFELSFTIFIFGTQYFIYVNKRKKKQSPKRREEVFGPTRDSVQRFCLCNIRNIYIYYKQPKENRETPIPKTDYISISALLFSPKNISRRFDSPDAVWFPSLPATLQKKYKNPSRDSHRRLLTILIPIDSFTVVCMFVVFLLFVDVEESETTNSRKDFSHPGLNLHPPLVTTLH